MDITCKEFGDLVGKRIASVASFERGKSFMFRTEDGFEFRFSISNQHNYVFCLEVKPIVEIK